MLDPLEILIKHLSNDQFIDFLLRFKSEKGDDESRSEAKQIMFKLFIEAKALSLAEEEARNNPLIREKVKQLDKEEENFNELSDLFSKYINKKDK